MSTARGARAVLSAHSRYRNASLPNPVYALRNGTISWTLAGLTLSAATAAL